MKHHNERRAYDYEDRDKTRLVVLVSPSIVEAIHAISEKDGVTSSHTIRKVLASYVAKRSK